MTPHLTSEEFDVLRAHLARAAGLTFDNSRRESMAYSVAERLRETGIADVPSYLELLDDPAESQLLLDEVTIQETYFFRNPPQVQALRDYVVPELLRYAETHGRRLRIWSAGCSTGEEPYSIAMMLRELLPNTTGWDVKVIATDISSRALEAARRGVYGDRAVKMASPQDLDRFFLPAPGGGYLVRQEVRDLVEFRHHNLVTEAPPGSPYEPIDMILCRNVTIYFARDTTARLMKRLHSSLRNGGYLCLGHSETLWQVSDDFELVSLGTGESTTFVYRRLDSRVSAGCGIAGSARRAMSDQRGVPLQQGLAAEQNSGPYPAQYPQFSRRPVAVQRRTIAPQSGLPQPGLPPPLVPPAPLSQVAIDLLAAAQLARAAGQYTEAVQLASAASVAEPLRAEAFYVRGQALVAAGQDADAMVDLRKAVYLEPLLGFGHFLLAGTLERLGHVVAAAREYAAAADTLGFGIDDASVPELGGRSVLELAQLCRRLERQLLAQEEVE